jgi:hypothetical protein
MCQAQCGLHVDYFFSFKGQTSNVESENRLVSGYY